MQFSYQEESPYLNDEVGHTSVLFKRWLMIIFLRVRSEKDSVGQREETAVTLFHALMVNVNVVLSCLNK